MLQKTKISFTKMMSGVFVASPLNSDWSKLYEYIWSSMEAKYSISHRFFRKDALLTHGGIGLKKPFSAWKMNSFRRPFKWLMKIKKKLKPCLSKARNFKDLLTISSLSIVTSMTFSAVHRREFDAFVSYDADEFDDGA